MPETSYAIAFGSNRRHGRHRDPAAVIRAAAATLSDMGVAIEVLSAVRTTPPLGPAGRSFANAAAIVRSTLDPKALLAALQAVERAFGRRKGRRWGPRVLDLDIILWSGGAFSKTGLTVPHSAFRERRFVLDPLAEIAPGWRDPATRLTIRELAYRAKRARPVDQRRARS